MLRLVDPFPDLPRILEWEISLALLVLGWSLLSLRSRLSGRARGPLGARSRRTRAALIGLGFALAAASFTYAMPNLPAPETGDRTAPQRLRGGGRKGAAHGARTSPVPAASGAEASTPSADPTAPPQEPGDRVHAQLAGSFGVQAAPDDRPRPSESASPGAAASPTPEPTPLPTVTPSVEPTPTPTP